MPISQIVANSLIAGSLYALLAVSFNLIYRTTKFFNFAHGSVALVGGYAVFLFLNILHFESALSIIVSILIAGALGFLIDRSLYLPLRKKKSSNMVLLVTSLGVFTIIQGLIAVFFSSDFQTVKGIFGLDTAYQIFGATLTGTEVVFIVLSLLITAGLAFLLRFTAFGKEIRAVSDSEEVAKIVGIDTERLIGKVFFIGSMIAGLAGIFAGLDVGLQPTTGMEFLLKGIVASVIGGLGSIYGGALGGFLLSFVENFGVWQFSGEWKDAIAFVVLIVFLLVRPQGITKQ